MKRLVRLTLLLICLLGAGFARGGENIPRITEQSKLVWYTDLESGMDAARASNRIALIYFFNSSAYHCKFMQDVTFKANDVKDLMASFSLVALRIENNQDLARQLSVVRAPTTILVGMEGTEVGRLDGFIPSAQFASALTAVLDGKAMPQPIPVVADSPGIIDFNLASAVKEFVVGPSGRIPGLLQLSPYLHGEEQEPLRSDPKFQFEIGANGGAFVVVFSEVSDFGRNSMDIVVDGRVMAVKKLEPLEKQGAVAVELQPGQHVVQIRNTGQDWIRLTRFEFYGLRQPVS